MIIHDNIKTTNIITMPKEKKDDELLTLGEVMNILKISKPTAYRYVSSKKFVTYKIGGGLRISKKSLLEFLKKNKV